MNQQLFDEDGQWLPGEMDEDLVDDEEGFGESQVEQCPSCGREVFEDADQCPHCGDWISLDHVQARNRSGWFIAVMIMAILGLLFVFIIEVTWVVD